MMGGMMAFEAKSGHADLIEVVEKRVHAEYTPLDLWYCDECGTYSSIKACVCIYEADMVRQTVYTK